MMVLRVALALVFLGVTSYLQFRLALHHPNFHAVYFIAASIGFLTIAYAVLISRLKAIWAFACVQVAIDVALITFVVYASGGIGSYLSILYFLSVIGASIILELRGGLAAAGLSSLSYSALMALDFKGRLPETYKVLLSPEGLLWQDVLTTIITNTIALFMVAYLTGYLASRTARVEKELHEKVIDYERLEALNRQIIENIHSGIMTLDETGAITSYNRAAEDITGYRLEDLYLRKASEFFRVFEGGEFAEGAASFRRVDAIRVKDGSERILGFSVSRGRGGDISRIVIFQDLTQLKAMEEQITRDEKLAALGKLAAGIAHEIRNPLASISGSIQLLRDDLRLGGEDLRLLEIVLRETERLNALITDFLLFAKPAGERKTVLNVRDVINDTLAVFKNSPEASGLDINCRVERDIFIEGNRRQVGQVFWNLFLNAAESMRGAGAITVIASDYAADASGARGEDERNWVEIIIEDTGAGIAKSDVEKIFDPFFSTKESGTGLGLSIVHRIVEGLGGRIEVESRLGKGSLFRLIVPERPAGAKIRKAV
jgi:two-component system sensor histidine kinase PilS (NtrC family)